MRIPRSAQTVRPPGRELTPLITSKVSGTAVSEMLERISLFCRCKVGRKMGGHPVDRGNEVSLPLEHKVNQRVVDTA